MMKGISINELAAKITANAALKRDYIVPTEKLTMVVDDDKVVSMELPDHGRPDAGNKRARRVGAHCGRYRPLLRSQGSLEEYNGTNDATRERVCAGGDRCAPREG